MGWLAYRRMNRFLVLRDAYGTVQAAIDPESELAKLVKELPYESVVQVEGSVIGREQNVAIKDVLTSHRRALRMRSSLVHSLRRFLVEQAKFVDVETPTLFRRTPGGAAEFMVPAPPPNQGLCYSLPQSPQQFKQLLMVGGIDRYFQIARCYRDEGSKGDRQPEFTQVDLEMSFTNQEGVMALVEEMLVSSWPEELADLKPTAPFPRLKYSDAMRLYGSDKPDMRIPWRIEDCTDKLGLFVTRAACGVHATQTHRSFAVVLAADWVARLIVCKGQAGNIRTAVKKEFRRLLDMNELSRSFAICDRSKKLWLRRVPYTAFVDQYGIEEDDCAILRRVVAASKYLQTASVSFSSWGDEAGVHWTLGQLRNLVADVVGLRKERKVSSVLTITSPHHMRSGSPHQAAIDFARTGTVTDARIHFLKAILHAFMHVFKKCLGEMSVT
ncbi:unnamed protein product [Heligmosomoides polygyrus]|uniref:AA_TRNA_LIGASE_II domain-containing protein n=1 Tax=Heligmosomoides polygyrus TaxID=6339 RepID=A0A183G735_HELPZ|nr:unnamed protein product [Heligmosomoides polygyrus]